MQNFRQSFKGGAEVGMEAFGDPDVEIPMFPLPPTQTPTGLVGVGREDGFIP